MISEARVLEKAADAADRGAAKMVQERYVIYGFAAFYMLVVTIGWLATDKVGSSDFFSQCGLVLAAVGLYHAPPPK